MKRKFIFTFLCFAILQLSFAQEFETIRETKKLIDSRDIYLNGGMRSKLTGNLEHSYNRTQNVFLDK